MANEGTVLWKCGACEDCFYDLQALAGHKCIGNTGTITLTEQCIKQLDEHTFATTDIETSDQVEQAISAIAALEEDDTGEYSNDADRTIVPFVSPAQQKRAGRKAKPTIISVNNSLTGDRKFKVHQKGKRSLVWAYFTALDCKKAMCCICQKVLAYCGTPTNLVYHLNRFHPNESEVVKNKNAGRAKYQYLETKIPKALQGRLTKKSLLKQQQQQIKRPIVSSLCVQRKSLADRVVDLIATDLLPATIVEGQGFKKFVQSVDPVEQLPDSKKIMKDLIPKRFYIESKKVKDLLGACNKVHLSVEVWPGFNNQKFLTVTSHFITAEFVEKCCTLDTFCLGSNVTSQVISTSLLSCISDWDVAPKVMCIVSNGQDAVANAVKQNTKSIHLVCLGHVLDKIIKDAFSTSTELKDIIQQCRDLVSHLKKDKVAKQKLMETQTQDKLQIIMRDHLDFADAKSPNCPLKPVQDSEGHWLTMFHMLQRLFTLRNIINEVLEETSAWDHSFSETDWLAIEETISLLKAFEVVTLELCTEQYPSLSKVIPIVQGLLSLVHNCNGLTLSYVERVRKDLLAQLRKHLGQVEQNITLAVATVLDPRFKNIAFQSDDAVDAAVQSITLEARKYRKLSALNNENEKKEEKMSSSYTDSLWACFDKKATPRKEAQESDDFILNEIKNYFDEPLIDRKRKPIIWWRDVGSAKFPVLSEIAKQMLSIPSTAIPPERIFMHKEEGFSERRKNIKEKYLNQLLFLNTNVD